MNGAIGTEGFVAWFYAIVYNYIRRACKNFLIKLFVHSIGLTLIIIGLIQLFIYAIPPFQLFGLILVLGGIVLFLTPFGVKDCK